MLPSIEPTELENVTGGRIQRVADLSPAFTEALQGLTKAVEAAGQQIAGAKNNALQFIQQIMQDKMQGGGEGGGKKKR